jgi:hypothetical protein
MENREQAIRVQVRPKAVPASMRVRTHVRAGHHQSHGHRPPG